MRFTEKGFEISLPEVDLLISMSSEDERRADSMIEMDLVGRRILACDRIGMVIVRHLVDEGARGGTRFYVKRASLLMVMDLLRKVGEGSYARIRPDKRKGLEVSVFNGADERKEWFRAEPGKPKEERFPDLEAIVPSYTGEEVAYRYVSVDANLFRRLALVQEAAEVDPVELQLGPSWLDPVLVEVTSLDEETLYTVVLMPCRPQGRRG
jgi:hypothetical protein